MNIVLETRYVWSLRLLVVLCLMAACVPSLAGYYSVSYSSGGTATASGKNYSHSHPYSQFGGGDASYSPDVSASYSDEEDGFSGDDGIPPDYVVSETAECQGAITATFTWHPNNPSDKPPHTAILREDGDARWDSFPGVGFAPAGVASDGLGHAQATDGQTYGESSGTRYTVVSDPGQVWSATTPPSPHAKVVSAWGYHWGPAGRARVTYSAGLYAIWIDTTNTVNADEMIYAEAGRKTAGTLTCILPNASFTNYNWSIPGPIFKQFDTTAPQGHVVDVSSADLHSSGPVWIYKDGIGTTDITCNAHLATSDGLLSVDVAVSKTLTVEIVSCSAHSYFSQISGYTGITLYSDGNTAFTTPTGDRVGMYYEVTSAEAAAAPHFPPGGELAGLQLCLLYYTAGSVTMASTNAESMLDNTFPYSSAGNIYGTLSAFENDDSPNFAGAGYLRSQATFDTYLMYKPRTDAADYIPLQKFLWTWNTTMYSFGTDGEPDGSSPLPTRSHPQWDHTFSNR